MRKLLMIIIVAVFIFIFVENKVGLTNLNLSQYISVFDDDDYASKYIYIIDRENKNVEYEKNAKSRAYPASLTKIMTTIVALEHISDLSAIAPVDVETYREMVANNASMAGFYGNEAVTYRDLLYGTILSSAGEAANSLAVYVGGDIETFVGMMNDKAAELGMKDTHFTNAEGLHNKEQYTTAYDMALLLDYALDNGHFRAIFTKESFLTTKTSDHPDGIMLRSTVLSRLDGVNQKGFDIIGGKSGTTYEAGECWATLGIIDGREYICIVMGAPLKDISNPERAQIADTIKLYSRVKSL